MQVDGDANIEDVSVAPARNDIISICSDSSIMNLSGYLACVSACKAGQCCFINDGLELDMDDDASRDHSRPDVQSCKDSHQEVCNGYVPCLSMQGIENVYRSPQDLVNALCTANNIRLSVV